ncbi:hypothetical protein [Mesorhizobium sp.]|uniref:hypothetical protein n=1 Tax=Mesorhizobium sp. TaxID=1871066 RepID=UPI000FE3C5B6|nr:hypothetical protein [Mesorhizobium sp.]RWN56423.1 MAG: hypothetical protein EOR98_07685 [Mesorhizobium sp.]RWN77892.1 MAG: hypothetical protein EOS02_08945 [Mesorhizobium sp.]RWN81875.1 MAG: hypothetical protein EOS01_07745 [Mesorhizobium sp.]RWN91241.1 MAG: hypothetical protein EOS04_03710 [Mesorhizobium sp.]RWO15665.1 MAG: hypothetical protein EOS15_07755 [Mesorhizobium sp.]
MPNTLVRAVAEGMPDVNRRRLLLGLAATSTVAAVAAALASASTIIDATAAPSVADAIPSTGKESLDALLLQLPPEEAHRLRIEFIAIISTVREMCARGEDRQSIRDFVRTRCQQNEMDWKREQGI